MSEIYERMRERERREEASRRRWEAVVRTIVKIGFAIGLVVSGWCIKEIVVMGAAVVVEVAR